jgi:hypothetical protein
MAMIVSLRDTVGTVTRDTVTIVELVAGGEETNEVGDLVGFRVGDGRKLSGHPRPTVPNQHAKLVVAKGGLEVRVREIARARPPRAFDVSVPAVATAAAPEVDPPPSIGELPANGGKAAQKLFESLGLGASVWLWRRGPELRAIFADASC